MEMKNIDCRRYLAEQFFRNMETAIRFRGSPSTAEYVQICAVMATAQMALYNIMYPESDIYDYDPRRVNHD